MGSINKDGHEHQTRMDEEWGDPVLRKNSFGRQKLLILGKILGRRIHNLL